MASKMSRSYRRVSVKSHRVYSVDDIKMLYGVSSNTVSNWVGEGLVASDRKRPGVFRGAMIKHFHQQRMARTKINLRPGEFKCFSCKAAVFPDVKTVADFVAVKGQLMHQAICPDCGAMIWKLSNAADCDAFEDCRNPNTTRQRLYEENDPVPAGIWISEGLFPSNVYLENDRIIAQWQTFAGRFDQKTIDAYLATLRYCEEVTDGKRFDSFSTADAAKVREDLKRRVSKNAQDNLSTSTVRHRASHLKSFFSWLLKQDEGARLPRDLPDYFDLPKAAFADALPRAVKEFPTIEEAEQMLLTMPTKSLIDRRYRAIFAIAFLGALRADTVVSLQIKHVDVSGRRIIQDGAAVRSKNGKSAHIFWFPIPKCFEEEVTRWVKDLGDLGFGADDALFPRAEWLQVRGKLLTRGNRPVPVMGTKHAVTEAFAVASKHSPNKYSPHSAKHTIGALRDERRMTHEQRRAWSENMGHESERITETYYGKLSDERRCDLIESIGDPDEADEFQGQLEAMMEELGRMLAAVKRRQRS